MSIINILKYTIIGGIFAVLFLPFFISDSLFFPFITGKGFAFRIVVEVLFGLWIILAAMNPAYRPKKSLFLYAFTAFLVIVGIANIFGINPMRSMWSNYERMEGYITLLHLYAYFIVAYTVLSTEKLWKWFWHTSIAASVIMCFYGILQLSGNIEINQGGVRLDGTFGNAIYLAVYMLFHIFITAMYFVQNKLSVTRRVVYGIIIALQLIILFYTATRGTTIGLFVGVVVATVLIAFFDKKRPILRKVAIGVLSAMALLIGSFLLVRDNPAVLSHPVLSRFATISVNETTTKSRFLIWNMALQGVKERPILGWGQENFNVVFNEYYNPQMYNQEQWFDRAHNVFLDWLINAGVLGLIAYLSLFGTAIYVLWRKKTTFTFTEKSVLTGLLVGYFIHNIFVFDNLFSYIFFFSIIAYICARAGTEADIIYKKSIPEKTVRYAIAPVVIVLIIISVIAINRNPIKANTYLLKSLSIVGVQEDKPVSCIKIVNQGGKNVCVEAKPTIEVFKTALQSATFGKPEIREHLTTSINTIQRLNIPAEEKSVYYEFALGEMKQQTLDTPGDARYHFILGAYLASVELLDEALIEMDKAIALSPKKQPMILNKGQILLMKKEIPQAVEVFKQAYELETENLDAKKRYVYALMYAERKNDANAVLAQGGIINDQAFLASYYELKNYEAVELILTTIIDENPLDLQAHISLASLYVDMGRPEDAIKKLEETIENNRDFREKGEQIIEDIKAGRNPRD